MEKKHKAYISLKLTRDVNKGKMFMETYLGTRSNFEK